MKVSLCVKKTQSVYNWKKISIGVYFIICIEVYIYSVWFLAFLLFPIEINLNHVARDRIVKIKFHEMIRACIMIEISMATLSSLDLTTKRNRHC